MSEPERLGTVLGRSGIPRGSGRNRLEVLALAWERVAGRRLAEHCRPTSLTRGTLTVVADGPAWASEASAGTQRMLGVIESVLGRGAVKRIKVRSRPAAEVAGAREEGRGDRRSGETEMAERVEDDSLRRSLERFLRASRAGRQNKHKE